MVESIKKGLCEYALGIDIGCTKIQIACIEANGNLLWTKREPIKEDNKKLFMNQVYSLCKEAFKNYDISDCIGIGVAISAVISKDNNTIIQAPNLPFLNNYKFKGNILNILKNKYKKNIPVVLGFDGTASIIAETWIGAGEKYNNVATVIIGTGIGYGLMIDGKIVYGSNNVIGAIGWARLGISKDVLSFEEICSGPAISYKGIKNINKKKKLNKKNRSVLNAKMIFDLAEQYDQYANYLIKSIIRYTGMNLANLVSIINPEIIILGGSVGLRFKPYLIKLKEIICHYAQPVAGESVILTCSELGNNAGALGASGFILFNKFR